MHGTGQPLGIATSEVPRSALRAAADAAAAVAAAKSVLVCGHTDADGDVVGSTLAIAQALRQRGAMVTVYNDVPYPESHAFLAGFHSVVRSVPQHASFDATIVVDAARTDRLGVTFPPLERRGTFVWIDHHRHDAPPGDVNYIDLTAASVGEQVVQLLDALEHPLQLDVAEAVYASLLADTGGFRYGNTSARSLRLAARLIEVGVDPWRMSEKLFESQPEARVRLLGRVLSSMWRSQDGGLAIVVARATDIVELGAERAHLQSMVNHVRAIRGVEVAVLLDELDDHQTRVVVRSRGNRHIGDWVAPLGVKGHKNAATFELDSSPIEAQAVLRSLWPDDERVTD
jgi:bifunctional oligoribonuclease and PAP phosphatase NrnA